MVVAKPPAVDPGAPGWFTRWAARLPDFYATRFPSDPVALPIFAATADLPDPARYAGRIVFNRALATACVSDGVHWFPVSLGAHL